VRADPVKLRRVLRHLVENAIKFTEAGGEIAVECDANHQAVRICVRDTGRGIPVSWLTHVFEPYVQVDAHLMPRGQRGLGLGLAISQRLATGMGGALDVESEMGKGSTFTLTLLRA
jgi:signal transduction histidine kinase